MINLSREQLHEEIWTEPMTKVSVRYGISDVALKKICKKHEIPTPIQGHWAKLAAGKKVKKISLCLASESKLNEITIFGAHRRMSEGASKKVKEVVEETKQAKEKSRESGYEDNPEQPHPIAQRMRDRLLKAKSDKNGIISLKQKSSISVSVSKGSINRATTFLHRLIMEGNMMKIALVQGDNHMEFLIDGEYLAFTISESLKKETHEITNAEVAANTKWENERKKAELRQDWGTYISLGYKPFVPECDYYPDGKLVFQFNDTGYTGIRGKFADGKIQTVESLIESILTTAKKHIAARKARAIEKLEDEKRWEERRRSQEEQNRRDNLEMKRVEALKISFQSWSEVRELRMFITEAKNIADINGNNEADLDWIDWAENYIDQIAPFKQGIPKLLQIKDFSKWELSSRY